MKKKKKKQYEELTLSDENEEPFQNITWHSTTFWTQFQNILYFKGKKKEEEKQLNTRRQNSIMANLQTISTNFQNSCSQVLQSPQFLKTKIPISNSSSQLISPKGFKDTVHN